MKKLFKIIIGIVLGVFVIAAMATAFYWYSYRPSIIVSKCSAEAKEAATEKYKKTNANGGYMADDRDAYYRWCLQEKGLVK